MCHYIIVKLPNTKFRVNSFRGSRGGISKADVTTLIPVFNATDATHDKRRWWCIPRLTSEIFLGIWGNKRSKVTSAVNKEDKKYRRQAKTKETKQKSIVSPFLSQTSYFLSYQDGKRKIYNASTIRRERKEGRLCFLTCLTNMSVPSIRRRSWSIKRNGKVQISHVGCISWVCTKAKGHIIRNSRKELREFKSLNAAP
jgi:hypothetical protein